MTTTTQDPAEASDVDLLEAVKAELQAAGGLLHGKYSGNISGVMCYCIVGAVRQAIFAGDEAKLLRLRGEGMPKVQHLCDLIAQTIPTFDPKGEEKLQIEVALRYRLMADRANGMTRVFVYNDYVLYTLPIDPKKMPDQWDPDVNARNKAIELLDATIARVKELV